MQRQLLQRLLARAPKAGAMSCLPASSCFSGTPAAVTPAAASASAHSGDAPAAAEWDRVCALAELPPRGLRRHVLSGSDVALCVVAVGGSLFSAIGDVCPHKDARLSEGDIEDASAGGACVKCPRHRKKFPGGLKFSVGDGQSFVTDAASCATRYDPHWRVPVHETCTHAGSLYVRRQPQPGTAYGLSDKGADKAAARSDAGGVAPAEASPAAAAAVAVAASAAAPAAAGAAAGATAAAVPRAAPAAWVPCVIRDVERVSADTHVYTVVPLPGARVPASPPHVGYSWHLDLGLLDGPPLDVRAALDVAATRAATSAATRDDRDSAGGAAAALAAAAPALVCVHREYTPLSALREWDAPPAPAADAASDGTGGGSSAGAGAPAAPPPVAQPTLRMLIKLYAAGGLTSRLAAYGPGHVVFVAAAPETTLRLPQMLPPVQLAAPLEDARPLDAADGGTLALIAGGTGITPMLQLARWSLGLCDDEAGVPSQIEAPSLGPSQQQQQQRRGRPSRVRLLVSNRTRADALGEAEVAQLVELAASKAAAQRADWQGEPVEGGPLALDRHGPLLEVLHTFTREAGARASDPRVPSIRYTHGRIDEAMVRDFLGPGGSESGLAARPRLARVVISGPTDMMAAATKALVAAGHPAGIIVELEA